MKEKRSTQLINTVNIFQSRFRFNFRTKTTTFTTKVGGLLVLITLILMTFCSIFFVLNFLETGKPVVSTKKEGLEGSRNISIFESQVSLGFLLLDGSRGLRIIPTAEIPRYVTFVARINEIRNLSQTTTSSSSSTSNGLNGLQTESTPLRVVPYSEIELLPSYFFDYMKEEEATQQSLDYFLLLDYKLEDMYLSGDRSNLPYRKLELLVFPCSLPDASKCASAAEIGAMQVYLPRRTASVDFSNKKSPVSFGSDHADITPIKLTSRKKRTGRDGGD